MRFHTRVRRGRGAEQGPAAARAGPTRQTYWSGGSKDPCAGRDKSLNYNKPGRETRKIWRNNMKNNPSLRFLLALGGQKVIVMQDDENTHVYSDAGRCRCNVSVERISNAVTAK